MAKNKKKKIKTKELWNLDITIAEFIYPRLKKFKKITVGFPVGCTEEEWDKYLDEMIKAFKILKTDGLHSESYDYEKSEEEVKRGLELFVKYYNNLWY